MSPRESDDPAPLSADRILELQRPRLERGEYLNTLSALGGDRMSRGQDRAGAAGGFMVQYSRLIRGTSVTENSRTLKFKNHGFESE
jgi:hypothetical protein